MQSLFMPVRHRTPVRSSILAIAVAATLGLCAGNDARAATGGWTTITRPTTLLRGDAMAGTLSMSQPLHIVVALKLRDRAGLDSFIANAASARANGTPMASMSPERFMADHAPTVAQANAVARYLGRMGFRNVTIAPNHLLVSADGTAQAARDAFLTNFAQIRSHDGRLAYANTDAIHVPTVLGDSVVAVLGLQNVHQAQLPTRRPTAGAHTLAVAPHQPGEFASIYGASGYESASDVTVGLVVTGTLTQVISDLNAYTTANGLQKVATQTVVTGNVNEPSGTNEYNLDSQAIVGMAGGQISKLVFYDIPSAANSYLVSDFNAAVSANKTKIIAAAMFECEDWVGASGDGSAAAADGIFAAGAAQGQTFAFSAGNSGADECGDGGTKPSWPANSPYVIGVGGTRLDATSTTWSSETVWNGAAGATGGSQSGYEPKPSWQTLWSGAHRGVPDVAFDADPNSGARTYVQGSQQTLGGTGLSASLFAGFWARILHYNKTIGFAGPVVYPIQNGSFHDITSGNNNGSTAAVGYDLASGRGSTVFNIFNTAIAFQGLGHKNPVASFGYTTSGLSATFADQSTTSDGAPVATHSWKFGDGTTSTLAAPTHAYAANGTYSVTETIHDGVGAAASRTMLVTVDSSGTLQLLGGNTGFESGSAPWTLAGVASVQCNSGSYPAHQGNCAVLLDDSLSQTTGSISQRIPIPGGKTSATLTFSMNMIFRGSTTDAKNRLRVQLFNPTTGALLKTVATYATSNGGYLTRNVDLTPYIGQTVNLKFTGVSDAPANVTGYQLDDITLTVH